MPQITKILYLVTKSEIGGAQRYIFDLATNLPPAEFQFMVAAGGDGELFSSLKAKNIMVFKLINLVREINPAKDIKAYFEIKKLIRQIKPDILHLNSSKAGIIGAIAGKHAGVKKIIYTVHGFVFNEPMPRWKKTFYRLAEKFSSRYKDKLICVSEFDRQKGIKNKIAPVRKMTTINNGIGQLKLLDGSTARKQLALPADKIIVGTIANFYPTKGLSYLIKAAGQVCRNHNVIFIIIGDGEQRQALESEIKKLNLTENFYLVGRKNEVEQYLKAFDIYTCSSVKEGFPYSILGAMQAGQPIVSTNVGGIPEMIENEKSGLLVEPAEPKQLAASIIKLIENRNLADQLGRQAQIEVNQKFSLEKMVKETKKIYLG